MSLHRILVARFLPCSHLSSFQDRGRTLTLPCLSSHLKMILIISSSNWGSLSSPFWTFPTCLWATPDWTNPNILIVGSTSWWACCTSFNWSYSHVYINKMLEGQQNSISAKAKSWNLRVHTSFQFKWLQSKFVQSKYPNRPNDNYSPGWW